MDVLVALLVGFHVVPAHALQCNSSYTWYKWAANSKKQDPCRLASRLHASCAPNAHPLQPLSYDPSGTNYYPGPNSSLQNPCTCSYVMYNLMAACGDCQVGLLVHASWPAYRVWAQSCEAGNKGGIYPDALPGSLVDSIPPWAQFSVRDSGDSVWSYGLSQAIASGDVLVSSKVDSSTSASTSVSCPPPLPPSPALPIGTAFAGLVAGLLVALLGFFLQRKRRAHVIPPPTRYHTAPDNTPLVPLVPRAAYSHGTNFLRRLLEHEQENDPRRIEPFDISTATGMQSFPPHPAVFPPRRAHAFPPTASASALSQVTSRGPSRQTSRTSLNPGPLAAHPATSLRHSQSQSKISSRPHTSHSFFSSTESPVAGPSMVPMHDLPPSEPPSPLPPDRAWTDVPEDPPAYRRKT